MRIVLAPDKFKDCLSAVRVADAMAAGLRGVDPGIQIDSIPMADGGEGTVDALVAATSGRFETRNVVGPLPDMRVEARFGVLGDGRTAVIEMSAASGLALLDKHDRDPMRTTSFGTGQLLMAAAAMNLDHIILGIGGSATVDGGIGAAQACGLPVILEGGQIPSLSEPLVGADLARVVLVKRGRGSPIDKIRITVAADVTNPLLGPSGAAHVFGPQKGATPQQILELDAALGQLAARAGKLDVARMRGAGAAGGMGFAMLAFFNATLRPGIDIVVDAVHLRDRLGGADLCLTGEGRFDSQSLHGKTAIGVARVCKELGIPCVALAGAIGEDDAPREARELGLFDVIAISDPTMPLRQSMSDAPRLLAGAAAQVLRKFRGQTAK